MISNYTGLLYKLSQAVDIYSSVNRYLHLNKCKSIKRVCSIKMHLFSKSLFIFVGDKLHLNKNKQNNKYYGIETLSFRYTDIFGNPKTRHAVHRQNRICVPHGIKWQVLLSEPSKTVWQVFACIYVKKLL